MQTNLFHASISGFRHTFKKKKKKKQLHQQKTKLKETHQKMRPEKDGRRANKKKTKRGHIDANSVGTAEMFIAPSSIDVVSNAK